MTYTEKDLVNFGNQLLSEKREVLHEGNLHSVTDADLERFKEGRELSEVMNKSWFSELDFVNKISFMLLIITICTIILLHFIR